MEFKDHSSEIDAVSKNYTYHETPTWLIRLQELLQQFEQWWQDLLEKLFNTHHGSGFGDSRGLSTLLQYGLYIAGFVALLLIFYLIWRRASHLNEEKKSTTRGASSVEKILDSEGYRLEAERLASQNNYKGACRSLYLCLLQVMHEKTVAVFAPAKTNYEYRYLLVSFPALQTSFIKLAEIVETVWFGNKTAEPTDYNRCLELLSDARVEVDRIHADRLSKMQEAV